MYYNPILPSSLRIVLYNLVKYLLPYLVRKHITRNAMYINPIMFGTKLSLSFSTAKHGANITMAAVKIIIRFITF